MFGKQNSIFLLVAASCLITAVMASNVREFSTKKFNANLLNLMTRSSYSVNYLKCFKYYSPLLNGLVDKYEKDHQDCCKNADKERNDVDEKTLLSRQRLANETDDACNLLFECPHEESIGAEYDCYATRGTTNLKAMRDLSNGATSDWAAYKEQQRLVTYNEEKCINKTRVCFEEESDKVSSQLESCLAGLTDVPTPGPTTTSTTVKVSSTTTTAKPTPTSSTTTKPTPTKSTTTKPTPTESTTTKSTPTESTPTTSTTKSSNENSNEEDD